MRMTEDERAVWQTVQGVYKGFLEGDRAAIDASISPDATIWDSSHWPLVRGKAELDALRAVRPSDEARPVDLQAKEPVIQVWGDTALVRHILLVCFADRVERIRNTSVWRRDGGRWLCVHNHEDA
jgi:ketosteroid isomerase-like protein